MQSCPNAVSSPLKPTLLVLSTVSNSARHPTDSGDKRVISTVFVYKKSGCSRMATKLQS